MFDLSGLTDNQRRIIQEALDACDFPFDKLSKPIPVEFADLSAYGARGHGEFEEGHLLKYRERVLGLAWYKGLVSVEAALERDEPLAQEVFLAEGAHMVDFFYMTPEHRAELLKVLDPAQDSLWFDDPQGYWHDVGEAFMGGFIRAYAPTVPVTLDNFVHKSPPEVGPPIRAILTPEEEGPAPEVIPDKGIVWGRVGKRKVHHIQGDHITKAWPNLEVAMEEGRTPCKVCFPEFGKE